MDNCGYPGGHFGCVLWIRCGDRIRRTQPSSAQTEIRPHAVPRPNSAPDLRSRRFSTVSTGAKNPMESVESSQSTKRSSGPTWGKPRSRAGLHDLSGCPQTRAPQNSTTPTRPARSATSRPIGAHHTCPWQDLPGTQPNQEAPSGEVSRRARRTGRVGGLGRAQLAQSSQRPDPCRPSGRGRGRADHPVRLRLRDLGPGHRARAGGRHRQVPDLRPARRRHLEESSEPARGHRRGRREGASHLRQFAVHAPNASHRGISGSAGASGRERHGARPTFSPRRSPRWSPPPAARTPCRC